jgi:hypothetical protein
VGEAGYFALFLAVGAIGASFLWGPIGQALARKIAGRSKDDGITTGEMAAERIADLEARLAELEAGSQARVAELEERLEFAERVIASLPPETRRPPQAALPAD